MTDRELPDKLTPVAVSDVLAAVSGSGMALKTHSVLMLAAHIMHETGGRACHNFNVGNLKYSANTGGCWQFFECGEECLESVAKTQAAAWGDAFQIRSTYKRGTANFASTWVKPPHPWSKFAAYETLGDGVSAYLKTLTSARYAPTWAPLDAGNLREWVSALGRCGYYTAGEAAYQAAMLRNWHLCRGTALKLPTLRQGDSGDHVRRLQGLVNAKPDGEFGPGTAEALRRFQRGAGLIADAVCGPVSWSYLLPHEEVIL